MDPRKKLEPKVQTCTESAPDKQPDFIEGWEGSLPTEPRPVGRPLTQAEKDEEKNIEWHYNPTRGQYWYLSEIPRNKKLYEKAIHADTSKSVIELDDSSDEEEVTLDEQTNKSENSNDASHSKPSIFASSSKASTKDQSLKNPEENISNKKRTQP